jgi:dTDP-glucose 4,6-dehydratase
LGWKPSVTFEEGIRNTVGWYLEHADWIVNVVDGSYQEYYDRMYAGR